MRAHYQFAMVVVKLHARYVGVKHIFKHSYRLTSPCVPNLNRLLGCNVDFKSDGRELCAGNWVVVWILLHKRLVVLKHLELTASANQSSVFRYRTNARYLVHVGYIERLQAAVVQDAPDLYHSLRISCDKAVQRAKTVYSYKRLLVSVKFHDSFLQIGIPNKNFKVEPTRNDYLMLLAVRYFSHCLVMASQCLNRLFSIIFEQFIRDLRSKILLYLLVFFLLRLLASLGIFVRFTWKASIFTKVFRLI